MSAPWLSRVAVWPATQTMRPPSVTTPGENARESWNGVFSMYSAAAAAKGKPKRTAARNRLMSSPLFIGAGQGLEVDRHAHREVACAIGMELVAWPADGAVGKEL